MQARTGPSGRWEQDAGFARRVFDTVVARFRQLNGRGHRLQPREWCMVAAIVAVVEDAAAAGRGTDGAAAASGGNVEDGGAVVIDDTDEEAEEAKGDGGTYQLHVLSMGTGTKCVGEAARQLDGSVLMDSHAEVIARRGFNRVLLQELWRMRRDSTYRSPWLLQPPDTDTVAVRPGVSFHLYISDTPCGDAALVASVRPPTTGSKRKRANDASDRTARRTRRRTGRSPHGAASASASTRAEGGAADGSKDRHEDDIVIVDSDGSVAEAGGLQGARWTGAKPVQSWTKAEADDGSTSHQQHGILRVKPGRSDLPAAKRTKSMSCSDKIARWSLVGLQSSLVAALLRRVALSSIVVSIEDYAVVAAHNAARSRAKSASATTTDMPAASDRQSLAAALQDSLTRCFRDRSQPALAYMRQVVREEAAAIPDLGDVRLTLPVVRVVDAPFPHSHAEVLRRNVMLGSTEGSTRTKQKGKRRGRKGAGAGGGAAASAGGGAAASAGAGEAASAGGGAAASASAESQGAAKRRRLNPNWKVKVFPSPVSLNWLWTPEVEAKGELSRMEVNIGKLGCRKRKMKYSGYAGVQAGGGGSRSHAMVAVASRLCKANMFKLFLDTVMMMQWVPGKHCMLPGAGITGHFLCCPRCPVPPPPKPSSMPSDVLRMRSCTYNTSRARAMSALSRLRSRGGRTRAHTRTRSGRVSRTPRPPPGDAGAAIVLDSDDDVDMGGSTGRRRSRRGVRFRGDDVATSEGSDTDDESDWDFDPSDCCCWCGGRTYAQWKRYSQVHGLLRQAFLSSPLFSAWTTTDSSRDNDVHIGIPPPC